MFFSKNLVKWTANIQLLLILVALTPCAWAWGNGDRISLEDLKVLTLHHGRMTTSRRTSPVPQLKCIGGTAGCGKFVPQVVQCYNQGSDGYSMQWECKTDMDNAYRFGKIEVVCEGYDYPGDSYVLRGSCGLEYTLDLTKEGLNRENSNGHNYYGGDYSYGSTPSKSFGGGDIIVLIIIGVIIYALYRTCIANNQWSNTNDDHPDPHYPRGTGTGDYSASAPPPPGFRPEYQPDSGAGCNQGYGRGGSSSGGGFWTGAATGGLLGYMFGSRNTGYNSGYNSGYNTGFGGYRSSPGWGGGFSSGSSGGGFSSGGGGGGGSSGTRTASGFGGTSTR